MQRATESACKRKVELEVLTSSNNLITFRWTNQMLWSVTHDCTCTCIADHFLMWKCHPALIEQRLYWHPCRSLMSDIVLQPFVAASSLSSSVFFLFEAARCSRFSPSNVLLVCPMIVLYELDTRLSVCHVHGFSPLVATRGNAAKNRAAIFP